MNYSPAFFEQQTPIALSSARAVLPGVLDDLGTESVVDVGCGVAAWASVAKEYGCRVLGVDGNVPAGQLLIEQWEFQDRDLRGGFDCTGFDLAICLEVGEHLPESSSALLVEGLCKARYVLFSAAHPGQGGVDHVNEQWGSWWEKLFLNQDFSYAGTSAYKWRHWNDERCADYYRENLLLFARPFHLEAWGLTSPVVDVLHPSRFGDWP